MLYETDTCMKYFKIVLFWNSSSHRTVNFVMKNCMVLF